MENQKINITKKDCQANFDWKFIDEIELISQSDTEIYSKANICFGDDLFIERKLGHYSSSLLLEIFKQVGKGTIVHCCKIPTGDIRYVVRYINMSFSNFTILDEKFPVVVHCRLSDIDYRSDNLLRGFTSLVEFEQGTKIRASIKSHIMVISPEMETKYEDQARIELQEHSLHNALN